jgi:L-gulonate 3-dehydrogenase
MQTDSVQAVALVGCGVVGRAWIPVFARAGYEVRILQSERGTATEAQRWFARYCEQNPTWHQLAGSPQPEEPGPVRIVHTLSEALDGVCYVQESAPEVLSVKQAIFTSLDRLAPSEAILASSTSSLDINFIAAGTGQHKDKCIVAHPCNPAYALPVVELLATADSEPAILHRAREILSRAGMKPVVLERFVPGFILNRLQVALMREALNLLVSGAASAEAIDTVLMDGLAVRWVLLGTFLTNHTNSDGGVREYFRKFGPALDALSRQLATTMPTFDPATIEKIGLSVDVRIGTRTRSELAVWRDRMSTIILDTVRRGSEPPSTR